MQAFRDYLKECMEGVPVTTWDPDTIPLSNDSARDEVNDELADITDRDIVHPEVVYEDVAQYLETQSISLPAVTTHTDEFLEPAGEIILPLVASDNAEEVVYLYFAFAQDEATYSYDVLAEIVTYDELEEITDVNSSIESVE